MHDYTLPIWIIGAVISYVGLIVHHGFSEQNRILSRGRQFDEQRCARLDDNAAADRAYVMSERASDEAFETEYRASCRLQWELQRRTAKELQHFGHSTDAEHLRQEEGS